LCSSVARTQRHPEAAEAYERPDAQERQHRA
jgi:hypothetical protein